MYTVLLYCITSDFHSFRALLVPFFTGALVTKLREGGLVGRALAAEDLCVRRMLERELWTSGCCRDAWGKAQNYVYSSVKCLLSVYFFLVKRMTSSFSSLGTATVGSKLGGKGIITGAGFVVHTSTFTQVKNSD